MNPRHVQDKIAHCEPKGARELYRISGVWPSADRQGSQYTNLENAASSARSGSKRANVVTTLESIPIR